jgi:WD40 repeat protein
MTSFQVKELLMARPCDKTEALVPLRSYTFPERSYATKAAFSRDGSQLAVAYSTEGRTRVLNHVRVWNIDTWCESTQIRGCSNSVAGVAFFPAGDLLVCVGGTDVRFMGGEIKAWQTSTWKVQFTIENEDLSSLRRVAVSPDSKWIATGSALSGTGDNKIQVWNAADGQLIRSFATLNNDVQSLSFSPDGKYLAAGVVGDRTASVWTVASGRKVWQKRVLSEATSIDVVYSPDGKLLATCGDKNVGVWNAKTGEQYALFKRHEQGVNSLVFNRDGSRLFSADYRELCAWDVQSKAHLWSIELPQWNLIRMGISADERVMNAVHTINSGVSLLQFALSPQAEAKPVQQPTNTKR